jgi:hypothetical protein
MIARIYNHRVLEFASKAGHAPLVPHGLHNEVAPWRESAPQPLSFTPREKAVVDQAFLLNVGTRCVMRFRDADGPT